MSPAKTNAERQSALRKRRKEERKAHKDAGRVPVTVHVLKEWAPEVRELEARLQRRERRREPKA